MLAVQNLLNGTKLCDALGGAILSQNNNRAFEQLEDVHSATVVYSSGENAEDVPIGFGIINRYSPNQLYCSLVSVAKEFETNFVNVERIGNTESDKQKQHTLLKIVEIHSSLPDLSGLPQYFTAFAEPIARPLLQCVLDQLVANSFGTRNVELLRNMTVDLYDAEAGKNEHSDELWRDFCGFLVADRFRYCQADIKCHSLISVLGHFPRCLPSNVTFHPLGPSTRSLFHIYDQLVTVMNRTEYLDFLLDLDSAKGVVAMDGQNHQPIGYVLALGTRILQCYGENEQIAGALLHSLISSNFADSSSISMFLRIAGSPDHSLDAKILPSAINIRRLRRFHSRIVPTSVKWGKVFCLNVGANLF